MDGHLCPFTLKGPVKFENRHCVGQEGDYCDDSCCEHAVVEATAARARLIAETIKPIYKTLSKHYPKIAGHVIGLEKSGETVAHAQWAELARDFFEAENHARALINSKSVKTNEETT